MTDAIIRTRKITWIPKEVAIQSLPFKEPKESPPEHKVLIQTKTYPKRVGNGHKKEKTRGLTDREKETLRIRFISKNGQFKETDCVLFKTTYISDSINEVGIFQITGFVSYLHREVACGRIALRNIIEYIEWMRQKYPGLTNFFWQPNVQEVRKQNWDKLARGEEPNLHIKMNWIRKVKVNTGPVVEITGPPRFTQLNTRRRLAWT